MMADVQERVYKLIENTKLCCSTVSFPDTRRYLHCLPFLWAGAVHSSSLVFLLAQQASPSTTVGKCLALQLPCQNFLARQAYLDVLLKCLKQSFHILPTSEAQFTLLTLWKGGVFFFLSITWQMFYPCSTHPLLELISGHFLFNCILLSTPCFLLTHCRCSFLSFSNEVLCSLRFLIFLCLCGQFREIARSTVCQSSPNITSS